MMYVAVDIGCIECGEESLVVGVFTSRDAAESALDPLRALGWRGGQHDYQVFEVPEMDKIMEDAS